MKNIISIQLLLCSLGLMLLAPETLFSQSKYLVQGYVVDAFKHDSIPNSTIKFDNSSKKIITNNKGFYSVQLQQGIYIFQVSHAGYDTLYRQVDIQGDTNYDFVINVRSSVMTEVTIRAKASGRIAEANNVITKKDLEKIPAFMGQRDPLKALQTLPGTGNAGEANSGLYVRGGTAGQNLTIFNEATVYNASHLLGFFSVFNAEAVDNIKLYKSGIPAQFGGRLSSIIEVNSDKKIADSASLRGSASILASDISIIMPINSNWSAAGSIRKTYMGVTIWPLLNKLNHGSKLFSQLGYDFSDLNFSTNARLSKNNYINFSAFSSGDAFEFGLQKASISNSMKWKNTTFSLGWNKILSDNLYINTTLTSSGYIFNLDMLQDEYEAGVASRIKDYNIKSTANFSVRNHLLKAGIQINYHRFKPNTPYSKLGTTELDFGFPNLYNADETSFFISDELTVTNKINVYAGGRFTNYRHKGPYTFSESNGREMTYLKGETVVSLPYFEPSLIIRNKITENSSLKISFTRNVQPLHLVSVTAVNFPSDFWLPSLKNLPPEKGIQTSAGYFLTSKNQKFEGYAEVYYKSMKGLVEYQGGIMNLLDNFKIEDRLLLGNGEAYGAEFYLKKKSGKLTGWLSYTLAKSDRKFPLIDNNRSFPAKYDRRHDVSLINNYRVNSHWSFAGYFTYATGNTYTKPVSRYIMAGNIINEYGSFNGSRMPAYHRLDLAVTYTIKSRRNFKSELDFSVYNVYNRQNPIFLYFVAKGDLDKSRISVKPESIAILPVLPSLTYRFAF